MKNWFLFAWVAAAMFISTNSQAQKKTLTNGTISYEMKMEGNPMASAMGSITMDVAFKEAQSSMKLNMMNGLIDTRVVMDNGDNKAAVMLMSMMGKKIAVKMMGDEVAKFEEQQRKNQEPPKITYYKNVKKKIAGFKCYKAVAEVAGAGEVTLFICDKIKPAATSQFQMQFPGMEGYPLSIQMKQQGMDISFTATKISTKMPEETLFDMTIPEGYDEMSFDELQQQGGGGGLFGM